MPRCCMDGSSTCVKRYIICKHNWRISIDKWMFKNNAIELYTSVRFYHLIHFYTCILLEILQQFCGDQIFFITASKQGVFEIWMESHTCITGEGPRCCCPYYNKCVFEFIVFVGIVFYLKTHVYGWGCMVVVLHFGVGQSCDAGGAPVNRFQTLVYVTPFSHFAKNFYLFCLVFGHVGYIGIFPVAPNTEPFELLGHCPYIFCCELFALFSELYR